MLVDYLVNFSQFFNHLFLFTHNTNLDNQTSAYFNSSAMQLMVDEDAFHYVSYTTQPMYVPFPWTPGTRGSPSNISWPPKGIHLVGIFFFQTLFYTLLF